MKKAFSILGIVVLVLVFFWQFIFRGLLPIPSDTIVGLYHPFRDLYAKSYPNGIPFKNFLITDPVRQQYPWKNLAVSIEKRLEIPLWNPYSFSGTPLLGNLQSGAFYPWNILFFILPFSFSWSLLIVLQPLLGIVFLYLYLDNLKLNKLASLFGAIAFGFSGFFIAWMEWGTVVHAALWLPLILLSIDKIFFNLKSSNSKFKIQNSKLSPQMRDPASAGQFKIKNYFWPAIFILSLASSLFAGHLQTFFYVFIVSLGYLLVRFVQFGKNTKALLLFAIYYLLFTIVTAVQWLPTLQFILLSARNIDQTSFNDPGWFIPWQHLIQFVAPDFFGNPTTLNYWGIWNYGEFTGYIGIFPLIMAFFALFFRHDKKTFFFGSIFFLSLIFALPTILAKLPYVLNIPFLSTSQPTRLLFITDFSLAVLSALGLDYLIRAKTFKVFYPIAFLGIAFTLLWSFVLIGNKIFPTVSLGNILVAKRNLYFPSIIFAVAVILIFLSLKKTKKPFTMIIHIIIVGVVIFDLFRFGWKFTPFTKREYLFPNTKTIEFLQKNIGLYRLMTVDSRIFPPNFSAIYKLQSVDGYDPLYLRRFGELMAASERGKADISSPFGFNRIITPQNFDSKTVDLLGVKYVLSLSDISSLKLKKVFQEGRTRIYENTNVLPRVFFVAKTTYAKDKNDAIKLIFDENFNFREEAIIETSQDNIAMPFTMCKECKAEIVSYSENKVTIKTDTDNWGFLVLTDSFYPMWHAKIDGRTTKIFRTDYNFRGIAVPAGKHTIEFFPNLF